MKVVQVALKLSKKFRLQSLVKRRMSTELVLRSLELSLDRDEPGSSSLIAPSSRKARKRATREQIRFRTKSGVKSLIEQEQLAQRTANTLEKNLWYFQHMSDRQLKLKDVLAVADSHQKSLPKTSRQLAKEEEHKRKNAAKRNGKSVFSDRDFALLAKTLGAPPEAPKKKRRKKKD